MVVVFGAADADRVAGTQPVVLLHAGTEADAALGAVTDAEVEGTGVAFFHLVGHVDLIGGARHALGFHVNRFEVAQTVQTLLALLDLFVAERAPSIWRISRRSTESLLVSLPSNLMRRT